MDNQQVENPPPKPKSSISEPRPDDFQSVEISAVVKIYDPNSRQVIVETRG